MPRYRPEHKQDTRRRLVASAVSTLRRDGVESAGLKQIMHELGLTVGGFYRHFPSKSALVAAAVEQGLAQSLNLMHKVHAAGGAAAIEQFSSIYLSQSHRRSLAEGCVLAALGSDIARGDAGVKAACEAGLRRFQAELERLLPADLDGASRDCAWALVALEVGGLLLSRMVAGDATAEEILVACRRAVPRLLPSAPPRRRPRRCARSKPPRSQAGSRKRTGR